MIDANRIAPKLWMGSRPPFGTRLHDAGFNIVVLCAKEWQPPRNEYPGITVLRCPIDDDPEFLPPEDVERAATMAAHLAKENARGKRILVTCNLGMNRSGLVCALVLAGRYGVGGHAAMEQVRRQRKLPLPGMIPLANPQFVALLEKVA